MTAFVDRKEEIEALEELWGSRFQLALLWGRRRVGKTRLLDEFATPSGCDPV
jgi:Archaeal ATPase.